MKVKVVKNYHEPIIFIKKMEDGRLIITDSKSTIRVLDLDTLVTVDGFKAKIEHQRYKNRVIDFSTDGKYFGTITADEKETRLYSIVTKKAIAKVSRHQGDVSCVGIDPRNRYLFSCGDDGKTFVIDILNAKLAFTLPPHPDTINDVAFNKSGQWVATCSYDRKINVYNLDIMQIKDKLVGHSKPVMKVCFISKNRLLSIDKMGSVIVWNLYDSSIITRLGGVHDDVTSIVADDTGRYVFMGTKLGYVIVFDVEKYEMISRDYLKVDSTITSMYFDNDGDFLYLGTDKGDIRKYYIYDGIDIIKLLIQKKDFGDIEKHINSNPLLRNTEIYDILETIWERTFKKAQRLLEVGKKDEASKILETYRVIPSKNTMINKLFQDYQDFQKFYKLAKDGKLALAYSLANQFPVYKESNLYKKLEEQWREKFKKAQKLAMDPRTLDQAKEILKLYRGISEKAKDIQEMFVKSDVYNRFKVALGAKDFAQVYAFLDKYPFLKQFPEYQIMMNYAESLYKKALENIEQNDLNMALKYLRMLSEFREYEEDVKNLIDDIETRYKFFAALKDEDLSKAYLYLSQNEELLSTPEGKKLEKEWNDSLAEANKAAAKGNIYEVKEALGKFMDVPSKYQAIASIFSYTYMSQLEQAIRDKLDQQTIEKGIKNYISYFGLNDQIENFYKIFKKHYKNSKLNIELLHEGSMVSWRPSMVVDDILE